MVTTNNLCVNSNLKLQCPSFSSTHQKFHLFQPTFSHPFSVHVITLLITEEGFFASGERHRKDKIKVLKVVLAEEIQ